ncbi:unnamed protein product [Candidula unifasciata]|uniref:Uncharacterized protein n=1 Tax=Candidula unifasciata TaxID=100452 RepID=A0A8S3YTC1_9EUPU|nr:unnamed protein product [Candidula unifasciata]
MTVIYFESVHLFEHDSYPGFIKNDGVLTFSKTQYLREICVREFTLSGCDIYVIKENALSSKVWERCLVKLDLSFNPFLGTRMAFIRLLNFKNIEIVIMDGTMERCFSKSGVDDSDDNEFTNAVATTSIQLFSAEET